MSDNSTHKQQKKIEDFPIKFLVAIAKLGRDKVQKILKLCGVKDVDAAIERYIDFSSIGSMRNINGSKERYIAEVSKQLNITEAFFCDAPGETFLKSFFQKDEKTGKRIEKNENLFDPITFVSNEHKMEKSRFDDIIERFEGTFRCYMVWPSSKKMPNCIYKFLLKIFPGPSINNYYRINAEMTTQVHFKGYKKKKDGVPYGWGFKGVVFYMRETDSIFIFFENIDHCTSKRGYSSFFIKNEFLDSKNKNSFKGLYFAESGVSKSPCSSNVYFEKFSNIDLSNLEDDPNSFYEKNLCFLKMDDEEYKRIYPLIKNSIDDYGVLTI